MSSFSSSNSVAAVDAVVPHTLGGIIQVGPMNCSTATFADVYVTHSVNIPGNVPISPETFSVWGTVPATSATTGSFQVAGGIGIGGNSYFAGTVTIGNSTPSTSPSTGALIVTGGVGVGGALEVAGNVSVLGSLTVSGSLGFTTLTLTGTTDSTSVGSGTLVVDGGVGIAKSVYIGGIVNITNTTGTSSPTTGALIVGGGVGVEGNVNAGGFVGQNMTITNTASISSLIVNGATSSGPVTITNATSSSSPTTGALIVTGGVGIGGDINVGGNLNVAGSINIATLPSLTITGTGDSSSTTTGALIVDGGVGIVKTLHIGTGIVLPTSGGTGSVLNYYEENVPFSFVDSGAFNGVTFGGVITCVGRQVTIRLTANMNHTPSSTGVITSPSGTIPARFCPLSTTVYAPIIVTSDSAPYIAGNFTVATDGTIIIFTSAGNFVSGHTNSGFPSTTAVYSI